MFLANLAHFMDRDIMHNFVDLVNGINVALVEAEIDYMQNFDEDIRKQFVEMSKNDFMLLLTQINDKFIK